MKTEQNSEKAIAGRATWRRRVALIVALTAIIGTTIWGRSAAIWWAVREANRSLEEGAISSAENWARWLSQIDATGYSGDLVHAVCYRHLGERDAWQQALDSAKQKGALYTAIRGESRLADFRWGERNRIAVDDLLELQSDGVPPHEAITVVVQGLLIKRDAQQARRVLEKWPSDAVDEAEAAYLRGLCYWSDEDRRHAQTEFEKVFETKPKHEMARASLGRLLEQQERVGEALPYYTYLENAAFGRESSKLDLARVLRKLGRLDEARKVLPQPSTNDASQPVVLEIAEREYASGNYEVAVNWFKQANIDGAHTAETLRTAASAMAFHGDFIDAADLFARVDESQANSRHASELRRRLNIDANDSKAVLDLQHIAQTAATNGELPESRSRLYQVHCSACHGDAGKADGRAARFLFPRPRNLRLQRLRLVSTLNGVAHRSDIERVIRQGIPGTSMPAFPSFTGEQLSELVEVVVQFRRQGVSEQLMARSFVDDHTVDERHIARLVSTLTTASEFLRVPPLGTVSQAAVERGRETFEKIGCIQCHAGHDGQSQPIRMFDDSGRAILPRDLAQDPLKGGADAEAIFRRIRLGMPGTPHPALEGASEEQLIDLVHYCRSLATESHRTLTNQQRSYQAAARLW